MADIYLICAAIGGTIFVIQLLLSLFGLGHHDFSIDSHDVAGHGDHGGHDYFLGMLSFRAIVAAVTFFGLAGLAANKNGIAGLAAVGVAAVTGLAAMTAVAAVLRFFNKLQSDGTARIEQSLCAQGSVYLTIPGQKQGCGKITVTVQGRTMEYLAVTPGAALPTGAKITIVDVIGPDTVEVEAVAAAIDSIGKEVNANQSQS